MGLNMNQKQAVTREYLSRYQKAAKKAKPALLDEFTRLTGYHRKSAVRLLSLKPAKEVMVYANGGGGQTQTGGHGVCAPRKLLKQALRACGADRH
jgi:hypothetical protein